MNANKLIIAAVNKFTLKVAEILGTNDIHTIVTINDKTILDTDINK
jgi:hypothetical protein